jgi:hypothetical protein
MTPAGVMARALVAAIWGLALGLSIGWLAGALPKPLGTLLILTLCGAAIWWALRQLRWARRMAQQIRDDRNWGDD